MLSSSLQLFVIQVYNVSKSVSIIFEGERGIHIIYKKRVLLLLQLHPSDKCKYLLPRTERQSHRY